MELTLTPKAEKFIGRMIRFKRAAHRNTVSG